jgi:hypothetical protein
MLRWLGLCSAAAGAEGSDGRQLAVAGAVGVAAAVAELLPAGTRVNHFSPKLLVCKALHYQGARSQSARVSACSACWAGAGAGAGAGPGAAGQSPGGERPGLLSSRGSRPEGRKHQGRAGHQTLQGPAQVGSAAAFVELKRSSVQDDSDHLLVAGPSDAEVDGSTCRRASLCYSDP